MRNILWNALKGRGLLAAAVVSVVLAPHARGDACAGRYTISNGTVLDNDTKLEWQQAESPGPYTLIGADVYCGTLNLQGTGWRLPTSLELQTIVDDSKLLPAIDTEAFPQTTFGGKTCHWSSSVVAYTDMGFAWCVRFGDGLTMSRPVDSFTYVRCVR